MKCHEHDQIIDILFTLKGMETTQYFTIVQGSDKIIIYEIHEQDQIDSTNFILMEDMPMVIW